MVVKQIEQWIQVPIQDQENEHHLNEIVQIIAVDLKNQMEPNWCTEQSLIQNYR